MTPDVEQGFRAWSRSGADPDDAPALLAKVHEAEHSRLEKSDPRRYQYVVSGDQLFDQRWSRIRHYRWNIWFEFAFLTGLILFTAWPWLRNASRVRWAIHIGSLPVLFCLPWWLGYAPLTFTSADVSGGVFYPSLLVHLRGLPWSQLDTTTLRAIPHPLEALSQTPGAMMAMTNFGGVGPVSMSVTGLVIALAIVFGPRVVRQVRCRLNRRTA